MQNALRHYYIIINNNSYTTVYKYGYIRINVLKKSRDLHTRGASCVFRFLRSMVFHMSFPSPLKQFFPDSKIIVHTDRY